MVIETLLNLSKIELSDFFCIFDAFVVISQSDKIVLLFFENFNKLFDFSNDIISSQMGNLRIIKLWDEDSVESVGNFLIETIIKSHKHKLNMFDLEIHLFLFELDFLKPEFLP